MLASQEECIRALPVIVEPLDQDGGAVEGIGGAGDVVEDVCKSADLLRLLWSNCGGLDCLLFLWLLRSTAHTALFPLAAHLEKLGIVGENLKIFLPYRGPLG